MLDVRRMLVLRAVVTSGSITAAARNLGYTPSAVSQQLSTLEREAGTVLLERVGRGVRPTAAGTLLSEHAELVSAQLGRAESALAELKAGRTGRLAIRYFATAGAALVPPAVAAVRREYPGIRLDLRLFEPDDPLPMVATGKADVAIVVSAGGNRRNRNLEFVHLLDDPYRAVLPKGHRLAGKRVLDLADLAEESWIGNEWPTPGPCREILLEACGAAGFTPNFGVEAEDYQTSQGFVAAGLGVTAIPALALGSPHPGVVLSRLRNPQPVRPIHAVLATHAREQPAVTTLLDAMSPGS
ncbi:LysR family transcriptional regulator [Amycolatopsis cihanbeyliensis]|uniref:DNA-binding transcriptional LysR family regulator n=1 Tax=Amycolatopsis cihanbeyliensis TaxID=1128664 RepID=A0A542DJE9_AMYCI|nr:LysR family transcriptional regulator [Amycolatopsis cihanbeyliensis]TQJ03085.1 DNA-binding transcriptional LysR family regulator [Amycolatopsis cihanbeyliensis]